MSKPSLIRSLYLLGAIVMLAPTAANCASVARHVLVKASPSVQHSHLAAPHRNVDHDDTWMMLAVGLAAVGFAIRRQQRVLGSLQPLIN
jgi:hypothetical protein